MTNVYEALEIKDMFVHKAIYDEYMSLVKCSFGGKGEKHHILPKSIYPEYTKAKWNLVNLRLQDHYKAHYLLTLCTRGEYLRSVMTAWAVMNAKGNYEPIIDGEDYARYKTALSKLLSGAGNPMYGKTHSVQARLSISKQHTGRRASEETRKKMSKSKTGEGNGMYGKTHTAEVRKILADQRTGVKQSEEFRAKMREVTAGVSNGMYGKNHSLSSKAMMSYSKSTYEFDGKLWSLNSLALHYGVIRNTLADRLEFGMQIKDALTFPVCRGGVLGNKLVKAGFVLCEGVWYSPDDNVTFENQFDVVKFKGVRGAYNKNSKLDETKVREIKKMLYVKTTQREIAEMFGVSKSCIKHISSGRAWGHVVI